MQNSIPVHKTCDALCSSNPVTKNHGEHPRTLFVLKGLYLPSAAKLHGVSKISSMFPFKAACVIRSNRTLQNKVYC